MRSPAQLPRPVVRLPAPPGRPVSDSARDQPRRRHDRTVPGPRGPWLRGLCAAALAAVTLSPVAASAQRPIVELPTAAASLLSASGRHVVVLTREPLVSGDAGYTEDVYRYALDTATWQRVPQKRLLGLADQHEAPDAIIMLREVSGDGRYLAYESRRSADDPWQFARYDFLTGERLLVRDASQDVYANPSMSRDGRAFAWIGDRGAVHVARAGEAGVVVGLACVYPRGGLPCLLRPSLSGDGRLVFWQRERAVGDVDALWSFDRALNRETRYPQFRVEMWERLVTNAAGSHVAGFSFPGRTLVLDTSTGGVEALPQVVPGGAISDGGVQVLTINGHVHDRRWGSVAQPLGDRAVGMSADGRVVAVDRAGRLLVLDLDGDNDGMRDPWETTFGLSPSNAMDGDADDDGDGVNNRDEYAARTHPRGRYRRYFAEGVTSAFFETTVFVQRTGWPFAGSADLTPTVVTFFAANGISASRVLRAPNVVGADFTSATVPPVLGASEYAVVVEAEGPIAAERVTTWPAAGPPRGAHASSGVGEPSLAWTFAEGATRGGLQTFYLLANPGSLDAEVSVAYLCADEARIGRTYLVPARGRTTVWVNQEGPPLDAAECGAVFRSDQPIVAERSMYMVDGGQFTAGTSSTGGSSVDTSAVASPHTWYFPAGATADPFDMFLTLVNTSPSPCAVEVTYTLPVGPPIARTHLVPASARLTIWADHEDAQLAQAGAVATQVRCPTGLVFAERAMWWRAPAGAAWIEGHVERGSLAPATTWAMAHVPESATIAVLNTSDSPGAARVRLYSRNGVGAAERVLALPPGLTVLRPTELWPALGPDRYGAVVESLAVGGAPPVQLIVERTAYIPGTPAGTTLLATPVP